MTDAIIQKIIQSAINKHKGYGYSDIIRIELTNIEQELIEAIKQTISEHFRCACIDTDDIRNALIGDSQE